MALNLVAKLALNARGFTQGLAQSQSAAARFTRFLGTSFAGGAAAQAGGFATQSLLDRMFGGAKKVANEIPGAGVLTGAADTIQPIIDPLGLKRKMMLGLAAAGAGAFFIGKRGIDQAAEIKDLAEQTEQTTSSVQRLGQAARTVGLDVANFQTALAAGMMSRKEAAEGNEKLRRTFQAMGLSLRDVLNPNAKSTLQMMRDVVRNANDLRSETFRAAFRDIFGRGSERLIPAVAALERDLGPVVSDRSINSVDRLAKSFDRLGDRIRNTFGEVTGRLLDKFFRKLDDKSSLLGKLTLAGGAIARIAERKLFGQDIPAPGDDAFIGPLPPPLEESFEDRLAIKEREKVADLHERIHAAELQAMSAEERRLQLLIDRLKIERDIALLHEEQALGADVPQSEFLEQQLKLARINADLAALDRTSKSFQFDEPTRDSLAKIGGFTPGVQNQGINIILQSIADSSRETAQNTRNIGGGLWP